MTKFDRLKAQEEALYRRQQKLHPLSLEWLDLELRRFRLLSSQ